MVFFLSCGKEVCQKVISLVYNKSKSDPLSCFFLFIYECDLFSWVFCWLGVGSVEGKKNAAIVGRKFNFSLR